MEFTAELFGAVTEARENWAAVQRSISCIKSLTDPAFTQEDDELSESLEDHYAPRLTYFLGNPLAASKATQGRISRWLTHTLPVGNVCVIFLSAGPVHVATVFGPSFGLSARTTGELDAQVAESVWEEVAEVVTAILDRPDWHWGRDRELNDHGITEVAAALDRYPALVGYRT